MFLVKEADLHNISINITISYFQKYCDIALHSTASQSKFCNHVNYLRITAVTFILVERFPYDFRMHGKSTLFVKRGVFEI